MILPARDKPIISMLERIRVRLMTKIHTKRVGIEKYVGVICPTIHDKLEKLKMESRSFTANHLVFFKYEVNNEYERHVVSLKKKHVYL
jgi:hypothetical protein